MPLHTSTKHVSKRVEVVKKECCERNVLCLVREQKEGTDTNWQLVPLSLEQSNQFDYCVLVRVIKLVDMHDCCSQYYMGKQLSLLIYTRLIVNTVLHTLQDD